MSTRPARPAPLHGFVEAVGIVIARKIAVVLKDALWVDQLQQFGRMMAREHGGLLTKQLRTPALLR